ncbi:hypothetical protein AGABI2DRAFT_226352 [Agaricus bisporus var. bisporus H97]|uniref:hypothetical protein n=1 Tax=Agaricus bisporus var. bisporus (strain H97 / ATCC MYA-4626 / FGSC 10389) TaxID=936046 RepID=UPI00029F5AAC|nr:hypothetical protein AGABI2DRAFT_226352 [Agaricus bisporus var. bisporus H97]EKV43812.1 hypothetical protein AGABI2DRAFT_226352 [Agaricus bisporus var. bisporus H97]
MLSRRLGPARYRAYLFLVVVAAVFSLYGFYAGHNNHPDLRVSPAKFDVFAKAANDVFHSSKGVVREHPIPRLMDTAEDKFRAKLKKQSKTLSEAVREYRRRYKRHPPKGFDRWWQFAQENNVKMVDEFDGLVSDLKPFWLLSGEEIRRRTLQAGELPSIHLVLIRDGESIGLKLNHAYEDSEISARAQGFRDMIKGFTAELPDMDFAFNGRAESRVIVNWEHLKYPNLTNQDSSKGIAEMMGGKFEADWSDKENTWDAWRRSCPPNTPARRLFSSRRNPFVNQVTNYLSLAASHSNNTDSAIFSPINEFQFMTTTNSVIDFCAHPHLHASQGHFFSDWRSLSALYPMFTPARAQGFMDIRVPSHYYYGSTQRYTYGWDSVNLEIKDVDPMEVPWEDKLDKVFWRGATTGGGSHPRGFAPQYQRHRFLRMSSDQSNTTYRTVTFSDPPNSNRYISTKVPISQLNDEIMDVAFVKAVTTATYPGGEEALMRDHRFDDTVPLGEHWKYRYLVDLDGMSYSGRFLAFLASDSVPVKATVYEEWFSDWIQPWYVVHFIPLSASYNEIYNIIAYFSGPTPSTLLAASFDDLSSSHFASSSSNATVDAERRLRRIARAGKEWKRTMGRKVDMEAYVYRLCLEWARLWADDRDSMDFKL